MDKLILANISKRYGNNLVVDDLSISLRSGEFVSLLGPSGCGKTTTLRMIAGFVVPTAGTIALDNNVLSSQYTTLPPEKRRMSMIFQSYALWPNMTVEQNVAFGLKMRKVSRDETRRRVNDILDVVKLKALAARYPNELSGGQQQRVSLARALVVKPEVLLLDEPLSNLDANLREEMRGEIRRLHNEFGITSIYVTHDQAEAMTTSDRIAVMSEGRIQQVDDPLTLYNRPKSRYVAEFIGRSNILNGQFRGEKIVFPGFEIAPAQFGMMPKTSTEIFSLRPQSIGLSADELQRNGHLVLQGTVLSRSYLGETWDYELRTYGDVELRVSTPPGTIFDVGKSVFLTIDPQNIVPIQG